MARHDQEAYREKLQERIEAILARGPQRFAEVVQGCEGAYPTVVRDCLEAMPGLTQVPVPAYMVKSAGNLPEAERSIVTLIEGNPLLCSWYFTKQTCKRLELLRDWSELKIAFLGTPRLYEWFAIHGLGKSRCLLDLDTVVLGKLGTLEETQSDILRHYDVSDALPEDIEGNFDCVFFDPPWYPGEYPVWINRAAQLAPNGLAHFSLFPELIRPSGCIERQQLFHQLKDYSDSFSLLSSFVEYDVPTFEDAQLRHAGISDLGSWKIADLVVASLQHEIQTAEPSLVAYSATDWSEVDIGAMRIFVNTHIRFENETRLLFMPEGASAILASPSRRNPVLKQINLLTSRGHGLITSQPKRLVNILEHLSMVKRRGEHLAVSIDEMDTDPFSKKILLDILEEGENA